MSTIIEVVNCFIEFAIFLFFCTNVLEKKRPTPILNFTVSTTVLLFHIYRSFNVLGNAYLNYAITLILWGTLIFVMYKDSFLKKGVILLTYMFVLLASDIIARNLVSLMFNIANSPMTDYQGPMRYIGMSIVAVTMLTAFALLCAFAKSRTAQVDWKYWLIMFFFPVFSLFIIVCCDTFLILSGSNNLTHAAMLTIIVLALILFNSLIFEFMKSYSADIQLESAKMLIRQQEENYTNIQINEAELSSLRHDILNHVQTMETMLYSNNPENAKKLLEEIKSLPLLEKHFTKTGDSAIDAILNLNAKKAYNANINYLVKTNNLTTPINMTPLDKSTLLSNALSNAIEGCSNASEKFIVVSLASNTDKFTICIENSSLPIKKENGIFRSTKTDFKHHGYGIMNMEAIVKKYNGNMHLSYENGSAKLVIVASNKGVVNGNT